MTTNKIRTRQRILPHKRITVHPDAQEAFDGLIKNSLKFDISKL